MQAFLETQGITVPRLDASEYEARLAAFSKAEFALYQYIDLLFCNYDWHVFATEEANDLFENDRDRFDNILAVYRVYAQEEFQYIHRDFRDQLMAWDNRAGELTENFSAFLEIWIKMDEDNKLAKKEFSKAQIALFQSTYATFDHELSTVMTKQLFDLHDKWNASLTAAFNKHDNNIHVKRAKELLNIGETPQTIGASWQFDPEKEEFKNDLKKKIDSLKKFIHSQPRNMSEKKFGLGLYAACQKISEAGRTVLTSRWGGVSLKLVAGAAVDVVMTHFSSACATFITAHTSELANRDDGGVSAVAMSVVTAVASVAVVQLAEVVVTRGMTSFMKSYTSFSSTTQPFAETVSQRMHNTDEFPLLVDALTNQDPNSDVKANRIDDYIIKSVREYQNHQPIEAVAMQATIAMTVGHVGSIVMSNLLERLWTHEALFKQMHKLVDDNSGVNYWFFLRFAAGLALQIPEVRGRIFRWVSQIIEFMGTLTGANGMLNNIHCVCYWLLYKVSKVEMKPSDMSLVTNALEVLKKQVPTETEITLRFGTLVNATRESTKSSMGAQLSMTSQEALHADLLDHQNSFIKTSKYAAEAAVSRPLNLNSSTADNMALQVVEKIKKKGADQDGVIGIINYILGRKYTAYTPEQHQALALDIVKDVFPTAAYKAQQQEIAAELFDVIESSKNGPILSTDGKDPINSIRYNIGQTLKFRKETASLKSDALNKKLEETLEKWEVADKRVRDDYRNVRNEVSTFESKITDQARHNRGIDAYNMETVKKNRVELYHWQAQLIATVIKCLVADKIQKQIDKVAVNLLQIEFDTIKASLTTLTKNIMDLEFFKLDTIRDISTFVINMANPNHTTRKRFIEKIKENARDTTTPAMSEGEIIACRKRMEEAVAGLNNLMLVCPVMRNNFTEFHYAVRLFMLGPMIAMEKSHRVLEQLQPTQLIGIRQINKTEAELILRAHFTSLKSR